MNGAAGGADLINAVSVNDGNFHHVVASYDGATMKIFLDGVLSAQTSVSTTINYEAAVRLSSARASFSDQHLFITV